MKKLIATVLTIVSCGAAYALPLGNPSEATLLCEGLFTGGSCYDYIRSKVSFCDVLSFRVGYYGDFVFNRHLEVDAHQHPDMEEAEIYTNAGYFAVNFCDFIDIFATFGASWFALDTNVESFLGPGSEAFFGGPNGNRFILESETHFSWSIGGRANLWQCGCTLVGIEAQYFQTYTDIERVTLADVDSIYPDCDFKYREWQVGVGVAHKIWRLVPYAGLKFSGAHVDIGNPRFIFQNVDDQETFNVVVDLDNFKSKFYWGYALGVSIVECEKIALTVEGRFRDEKAVYVNGQVRF